MRQHQLSKLEKERFCNQEKKSWKPVKMKLLMDFQFFFVGTNAIFRSRHRNSDHQINPNKLLRMRTCTTEVYAMVISSPFLISNLASKATC